MNDRLSFDQIQQILKDNFGAYWISYLDFEEYALEGSEAEKLFTKYTNAGLSLHDREIKVLEDLGLGKITTVDGAGGEGRGEYWHKVVYFVEHDVYLRVDGEYYSYVGIEISDNNYGYKVKPKEKTITVYE